MGGKATPRWNQYAIESGIPERRTLSSRCPAPPLNGEPSNRRRPFLLCFQIQGGSSVSLLSNLRLAFSHLFRLTQTHCRKDIRKRRSDVQRQLLATNAIKFCHSATFLFMRNST